MAGQSNVVNPINCTDIATMEMHDSKLRSALGWKAQIFLCTINRPTSTTARSPWELKNLCKRVDHHRALNRMVDEEADLIRELTRLNLFPPNLLMSELCRLRMLQEYLPRTLADVLSERYRNQQGPLEPAKAMKVVVAVLETLQHIHENLHLIHGDLKSFHIIMDNDFQMIKLSGYGAKSKVLNSSGNYERGFNTDEARNIGIGLWTAPEALSTSTVLNCKVDIFSLGMVVYEMLACMPPHTFPGIKDTGILETEELLKTVDFYNKERAALYRAQNPRNKPRSVARKSTAPYCPQPKSTVMQQKENLLQRTNEEPSTSSRTQENRDIQSIIKALDKKKGQSTSTAGKVAKATQTEPRPAEKPDCLNYAALGTRPLLPSMAPLGEEYELLFEIFYVCTEQFDNIRPTARELLNALKVVEQFRANL